jgi:endogenous inhibitor of DNA gyrase (YacG/DUF329 family)
MERLTGGLEYCRHDGCMETVHREDYPGYYPFCDIHIARNKTIQEWPAELNRVKLLGREVTEVLT